MSWFFRKLKGGIRCLKEHGLGYTMKLFLKKATKKVLSSINNLFRKIANQFELGFLEIINVKTYVKDEHYGRVYFVFLFGKQIYPIKRQHQTNTWVDPKQPIMYFKINRLADYSQQCVQHWIDIAYQMKADYYFICDNMQLEYNLLRNVTFPNSDIKFMKSMRKTLKSIAQTVSTPQWQNTAYAHLTPFYHAKANGMTKYWCIDADDMTICLSPRRAAEIIATAQSTADAKNISAFSLDVWRSCSRRQRHWTWGVAYVIDNVDFCSIFNNNADLSWMFEKRARYRIRDDESNFDWYFCFLKEQTGLNIETFYMENTYFIHWGDFLNAPRMLAGIYYWENGKLTFPIRKYVHEFRGTVNIGDCIKIDIGAIKEEGIRFFNENLSRIK